MAKRCKCRNLFAVKYFPCFGKHIFQQSRRWKNQNFSFRPNYGGACRALNIKFQFFKYTTVTCLTIWNNSCLFFLNYFQVMKIWSNFKVISTNCFKDGWVVSKKLLTITYIFNNMKENITGEQKYLNLITKLKIMQNKMN